MNMLGPVGVLMTRLKSVYLRKFETNLMPLLKIHTVHQCLDVSDCS